MIRLSKSCIGQAEKKAVMGVLDREYLGMGDEVNKFEGELSRFFGRNAVCVNTGTSALQLALQGCGIGKGDEVLVQSMTYVACFQAISATGAKPMACDVDEDTITINVEDAEKRITDKTKAIMPVHYAGGMGRLNRIYEMAEEYELRVIEDACHAFGGYYEFDNVGSFGDVACFSFDGIKNITCCDGGAVVSSDEEMLDIVRDARLLGVENDTEKRFKGERSWDFDVKQQGWRYHMGNINAAIGLVQLQRLPEFAGKRRELAKKYFELLDGTEGVELLYEDYDEIVPHIFVVKVENRDVVRKFLETCGIQTGVHYFPNHRLSFYKAGYDLPITDKIYRKVLSLPLHPDLSFEDVEYVCGSLKEAVK